MPAEGKVKALIAPHSHLDNSGANAAWTYKNLAAKVGDIDRIVLLGPSHRPLDCDYICTTTCTNWVSPMGVLKVD